MSLFSSVELRECLVHGNLAGLEKLYKQENSIEQEITSIARGLFQEPGFDPSPLREALSVENVSKRLSSGKSIANTIIHIFKEFFPYTLSQFPSKSLPETPLEGVLYEIRGILRNLDENSGTYKTFLKMIGLLEQYGLIFKDMQGISPLHLAADSGSEDAVRVLLHAGLEVDVKDLLNRTPLHYAVKTESKEIILLLLDSGAQIDVASKHGETPLHLAAMFGLVDTIRFLLKAGARVDVEDCSGKTPLDLAIIFRREESVQLLRDVGAKQTID